MVAVGGLHDAGVAGLAVLVEAPVVKGADHLAGVDILIQTAVVLGAGVGGILGSQSGKALLGGVAVFPGLQPAFGLFLGSCLLLVGVGGGVLSFLKFLASMRTIIMMLLPAGLSWFPSCFMVLCI